jgi:TRAP-type C4-dicarboxylate transport system substrate-binding protein
VAGNGITGHVPDAGPAPVPGSIANFFRCRAKDLRMRRALRMLSLLVAWLLAAAVVPASAQEVTLRVAHFLPTSSTTHAQFIVPWCERIRAHSGGRLRCQIFPAMQLGGTPPQLFDQARDGIADIVWTLPGYTAGRFPITEVFELPFMTPNATAASQALWTFYERHARQEFDAVRPLALHVHDNGQLHLRERPIRELADFRGLKIRAPTRQTNRLLARLGATPVSMPVPALAEALSRGVIDGAVVPWEVVPSIKVHEMVRYHSETDPSMPALYTAIFLLAMNKRSYENLPPELRRVIDDNSGLALARELGQLWDGSAPAARRQAIERGNAVNVVPAAEVARWERAARPLHEQWVAEMNARGLDGAALLAEARALIAQYASAAPPPARAAGAAAKK